jgi:hypothetical protein
MSLLYRLIPVQLRTTSRSFTPVTAQYKALFHTSRPALQDASDMSDKATGLKATKGIELLTWGTPNGWKASIILEELKEAYGKVSL